ncbi:carbamoyltransferase [Candidatus Parcubacteria bacterium]|nr:carbamoyltransferase [Candidatus Parcubacteria bacterium]
MTVLGIQYDSHDSGAAIVRDGHILAAINEERLSRKKMDDAVPFRSVVAALEMANLSPAQIDLVALSGLRPGFAKYWWCFRQQAERAWVTRGRYLRSCFSPRSFSFGRLLRQSGIAAIFGCARANRGLHRLLAHLRRNGFRGRVVFVAHDLAHAATAYYTSGFPECFVAVIEGSSFTNTASFWWGEAGGLRKVGEIPLPHSLGRYYEVVTRILGFHPKKHGGKITGLAAFGDSQACHREVSRLVWQEGRSVRVSPELFVLADAHFLYRGTPPPFCQFSREDVAAAFQKRLEEVVLGVFKEYGREFSLERVALAGGVFANVKLNMLIAELASVRQIFVHPGMGDMGEALGAALQACAEASRNTEPRALKNVYLGPAFSERELHDAFERAGLPYRTLTDPAREIAELLQAGKVVALFQGRMEYGPRALGHRSILYPATDPKVNDWLNQRLRRTEFMPFAPVTLAERAEECYEGLSKCRHAAEFMTIAVRAKPYMRRHMSAAVHVDGTARPQLISREIDSLYYDILKEYERLTGLPSLINTSFNMHEEPIVCTPTDAVRAFLDGRLDVLVLGPFITVRESHADIVSAR